MFNICTKSGCKDQMSIFINSVLQFGWLQLLGTADETVSQDTHSTHSKLFQNQPEAPGSPPTPQLLGAFHSTLSLSVSCSCQPSAWGVKLSLIRVCSPVFPMQGRLPFEFWSRARCFHSTSQPGNNNSTSGIQLLSQKILHWITTKPQGCSKHPLSAKTIPLPEIRKQEHAQPSLLGASSSSTTQLCGGLSTSVSQYSSHWLNCTCLPIS